MLRALVERRLRAEEKKLGASLDYARFIRDASWPAFFRFLKIMPITSYRKLLPAEAKHVAELIAVRHEDCGSCVQMGWNLGRAAGVPAEVLRAAYEDRLEDLPEELAEVHRFTTAVLRRSGEEQALREKILGRWGEAGLVELGMAIAGHRFYPTMKRALGFSTSCEAVRFEG